MGVMVDTDHSFSAHEQRALNGKEANRAAAPYSHCVAFLDVGIVSGHPAGGNDVGQEQNLLVVHHFRHHDGAYIRSEEHTSELQSLMRISYPVSCLKKTNSHCKLYSTTLISQHLCVEV